MTEAKTKKKSGYEEALKAYSQAMKEFKKGNCDKTVDLFTAFLDKHSSEVDLADRARLYLEICEEKKAKPKISLKTFEDYMNNAVYDMNSGDFKNALKYFSKAAEMKPKEAKIPYLAAVAHFLAGKKEEGLNSLKKAVKMDGFYAVLAQNEADFEPLWEDDEFKAVIADKGQ